MPSMSGKKALKLLKKHGWELIRVKGSHHYLKHPTLGKFSLPIHGGQDVSTGLYYEVMDLIEQSKNC